MTYPAEAATIPSKILHFGDTNQEVILLQKILNSSVDTQVALSGPGSPGQESTYFGVKTLSAVKRFQSKYQREILLPVGLLVPTGVVGTRTLQKLSTVVLSQTASQEEPTSTNSNTSPVLGSTNFQNPNLNNLDKFLSAIDNVAIKQGIPAATLSSIKEQVIKEIATTTDLRATFLKIIKDKSNQTRENNSLIGRILVATEEVLEKVFMPERAQAATGVPFGGALLFPFFCNQSNTWLITIQPLPPSYAALLTYVPGSQAFLSYNIPFTEWLLGEYEPGAGVCIVGACPYCYYIPSEGMISPVVGSSSL